MFNGSADPVMANHKTGVKKLVLLGAGHAHVHVLSSLARQRPRDLEVTLVTPQDHQTYSGMVPGFVAGCYAGHECRIALTPLMRAAGVQWVAGHCTGLRAAEQMVDVSVRAEAPADAVSLDYDLLSIDTGAVVDRLRLEQVMPGAAEHALMLRPIDRFVHLWPQVLALARRRPLQVVVVGGGAAGLEVLMAARQRLLRDGVAGSRFTLVTGGAEPGSSYPAGVRRRISRQLKAHGIAVVQDTCIGMDAGLVRLAGGGVLPCDVPILAIGTHAPAWLLNSGLNLSPQGHILVNAFQQSTSHDNVFAAGDVATRADQPHPKSGVYAVRAGPALATNLMAWHAGAPLKPHHPPSRTLNLLSCGSGHAIASWGPFHAEGAWAWRWKDRIDRAFIRRYCLN